MPETTDVNGIEAALRLCGVTATTLAAEVKESLDREGYRVFPGLIATDWLAQLREAFERAMGPRPNPDSPQTGTRHVESLACKDAAFDRVYTQPTVLAAVYHVLRRPFRVFLLSGRDPLPGYGQQGLHTDWTPRGPTDPFSMVTTLWLLDDFTATNGATRLVPRSHLNPTPLPKSMQAPENRHRDQKILVAPAGSVVVFNAHLWHSGSRNESNRSRRVLQCQFVARDAFRPADTPAEIPARLSPAARYILGY
jgi:ectoine hydroxylase-related dioxygenase (phytanoyl-CoA dioxygenase family)